MGLKENDIRPDHLMEGQQRFIKADRERLLSFRENFVNISCPACESNRAEKAFDKNGLTYQKCLNCETLYINPRPTPGILEKCYADSEVYAYWNKYIFPTAEESRRKKIFRPRAEHLVDICKRYNMTDSTLVEIGAGFGSFCIEAKESGNFDRVIAVEPTHDLAESCRSKGLEVIEKPVEHISFGQGEIDIVASFEVIEHLFSPGDFLSACSGFLSPGGVLVLSCPNYKGFDIYVLQENSQSVDHEHLNYFTPDSLAHLVSRCGFDILEISTPGQLDAEIVRKTILRGEFEVSRQHFLKLILLDEWERVGDNFQKFLADNLLSSHMWLTARKKTG